MTKDEFIARYAALGSGQKVRFLAIAAHWLTFALRGDYDNADAEFRVKRLEGANELQHHLSSELLRYHEDDLRRYPDEGLIGILVDKAGFYGLGAELRWAMENAMRLAEAE